MFIIESRSISPQSTFDGSFEKGEFTVHNSRFYNAIEPDYSELIPASLLRRMGKAVRMGIGAGIPLIKNHQDIKGIIIGTANGGLENCINFLNQIVDHDEGRLTPTNFVQSTPNALAGQLALMDNNPGYNVTHVNGSLSFENALLDGEMYLENCSEPTKILIGACEEISDYNFNIDFLGGRYKNEIVSNDKLLSTNTEGSICGEGSNMFVCSNNSENAIAEILEIEQLTYPDKGEIELRIDTILEKNNMKRNDVDLLILGNNGDNRYDHWYDFLSKDVLPNTQVQTFKNYVGEYRTVSSFALYLASQYFSGRNTNFTTEKEVKRPLKTILIYNHFDGIRHGFILLKKK